MAVFEGWAVLELLGHRVRYGRVSEVTAFGEPMCRIDIPTEPPTFELYAGKSIYGLRPASEESIRAYHAPRRQLPAAEDESEDIDVDEFDADTGGQHDDEPDDDDDGPQCAFCAEPFGDEPTTRVETGPDDEGETWHERCAKEHARPIDGVIDSDQPRGDL